MLTPAILRSTRERLGETQAQFARRFGVDQTTIHRWESDGLPERGPARMALERVIAEVGEQPRP